MIEQSYCCKAPVVEALQGGYVCLECSNKCDIEEVCGECYGTGEVAIDVDDGEGHSMAGVGTIKCNCKLT